jgi:hypothetical protein
VVYFSSTEHHKTHCAHPNSHAATVSLTPRRTMCLTILASYIKQNTVLLICDIVTNNALVTLVIRLPKNVGYATDPETQCFRKIIMITSVITKFRHCTLSCSSPKRIVKAHKSAQPLKSTQTNLLKVGDTGFLLFALVLSGILDRVSSRKGSARLAFVCV